MKKKKTEEEMDGNPPSKCGLLSSQITKIYDYALCV